MYVVHRSTSPSTHVRICLFQLFFVTVSHSFFFLAADLKVKQTVRSQKLGRSCYHKSTGSNVSLNLQF